MERKTEAFAVDGKQNRVFVVWLADLSDCPLSLIKTGPRPEVLQDAHATPLKSMQAARLRRRNRSRHGHAILWCLVTPILPLTFGARRV